MKILLKLILIIIFSTHMSCSVPPLKKKDLKHLQIINNFSRPNPNVRQANIYWLPSQIGYKSVQDTLVFSVESYIETILDVGQNMQVGIHVKSFKQCSSKIESDSFTQFMNELRATCLHHFDARKTLANWKLGKLLKSESAGCEVYLEVQVLECDNYRPTNLSEAIVDIRTIWVDTIKFGEIKLTN